MVAVRTAGAALGILAVLVGMPAALWLVGRELLPATAPTPADVLDVLSRPDDGSLLVGVLLVAGVMVWAQLSLSILAELLAVAGRRPGVRVELPGLAASRLLASVLVAGLLCASATTASAAPARPVSIVATLVPTVAPAIQQIEGPHYDVQSRDTLWRIAESELGDPLRWQEIYALNAGVTQADGGALTDATLLHAGWILTLPAAGHGEVVVRRGDTLSGIADRDLHDVRLTDELFSTNVGRPQPNGRTLSDPDRLLPGWTLTMPTGPPPTPGALPTSSRAAPTTAPRPTSAPTQPSPPPSSARGAAPQQTSAPDTATPAPAAANPTGGAAGSEATATPIPTTPDTGTSSVPASPSATTDPSVAPVPHTSVSVAPLPVLLGVSSLVVSGLAGALVVRRRRQMRHRRARHTIAVPDDRSGALEWAAVHAVPAVDADMLDAALRALTLHDWTATTPPELSTVELDAVEARLTVTEGSLAPPFEPEDDGTWRLPGDAVLPLAPGEAGGRCAPFPLLVSVAHTEDGRTLLVDLEADGVVHVTGERDAALGLMRHIAAELANARWAEDVEILLVGFGQEMLPLNPDRLRMLPDLTTALTEIRSHARRVEASLDTTGETGVLGARLGEVAPDAWLPIVLLANATALVTDTDREELRLLAEDLERSGRRGVAVVTHDIELAGTEIHISVEGELVTRHTTGGHWTAENLSAATATGLAGILAPAGRPDQPVGPAVNPQPWAEGMDADGALTAVPAPSDPEAQRRLEIVEAQDPALDDDLARWQADGPPALPLIGILGEPAIRAPGELPATRQSWFTEVLVYLSLHTGGVSLQKVLTDLWPDGRHVQLSTVRSAIYGARRWAGRGLDGDPERAFVSDIQTDSHYRLRGHLLDWDLFRRLRKRAQARHSAGHPAAVGDYRAALSLIRGPALSCLRPDGYAWLAGHDQRHDLQIPGFLVDTAHELVEIALADGDTVLARWAAETARSVDSDTAFDRPLTDLMRIAHAEDQTSELERYAEILLQARGFDVPEELPPDTFAVLNALLPEGPRRRRNYS